MTRKIVSADEILTWMNAEIRKHDECAGCLIVGVVPLRGTDGNWSHVTLEGSGVEACGPIADRVLAEAHAKFKLRRNG